MSGSCCIRSLGASPDGADFDSEGWRRQLWKRYSCLPEGPPRYAYRGVAIETTNVCRDTSLEPIRCVGNHNSARRAAAPRAHHKFLVFCEIEEASESEILVRPRRVWTGSYNLTMNAGLSLENAVILDEPQLVTAYYAEWAQIAAMSEPLNWHQPWAASDLRHGT